MKKYIIPVTEPEYTKGKAVFDRSTAVSLEFESAPAEEQALSELVTKLCAVGVILGASKYTGPLYDSLPSGGIIARFGVGVDGVDKEQAKAKGIYITNTPGVLDASVAELAIYLMGSLARNIPSHSQGIREGKWSAQAGIQLKGKTLSLAGFGRIAKEVARIAAGGLGMDIIACDIMPPDAHEAFIAELSRTSGTSIRYTNSLEQAMSEGDFVSIHLPLLDSTKGLIDAARLSVMQRGAYLVNTARGGIVDEIALYDALSSGHLAGAGFDVYANEPYSPVRPDKDLRTLPNLVMTPHTGSNSDMANQGMAEVCAANIRAYIEGRLEELACC